MWGSEKQIGIDLKTAFKCRYFLLGSVSTVNINALSDIIEIDETFFPKSIKRKRYISHRKARKCRRDEGGDKRKNK
ncbi:MAG: hypothetical protein ACTS85_03840 [Arsenophonus sp. NC-PG7-MAG3]